MARCEWNPAHQIAVWGRPPLEGDCPNKATVALGVNGDWQVCASCAALPEFQGYKVRRELERGKERKP